VKRALFHFAIIAILIPGLSVGFAKPEPSPEMKAFLKERLIGEHDLNLKGLKKTDTPFLTPEKGNSDDEIEIYQVPAPKRTADYFHYTIMRETVTNRFTVMKRGGFAGILEFYTQP